MGSYVLDVPSPDVFPGTSTTSLCTILQSFLPSCELSAFLLLTILVFPCGFEKQTTTTPMCFSPSTFERQAHWSASHHDTTSLAFGDLGSRYLVPFFASSSSSTGITYRALFGGIAGGLYVHTGGSVGLGCGQQGALFVYMPGVDCRW